jgi:tRNA(fMet)-specific endonuclease VapC
MASWDRNSMGIIYDTAVLIEVERNGAELNSLLRGEREGPFGISVVSVAELLHGAHRADTEERRVGRLAFVDRLCEMFPIFDYDLAAAKIFATIWSSAARKGISIGINDLIIAATAMSRGYSVLTINRKDFQNIEGLRLEVPESEK